MSIARNSAVDALSQAGVMVFSLATSIAVSRTVGSEGRGLYMLATLVGSGILLNLANLGLQVSLKVFAAKRPDDLSALNTLGILVAIATGALAIIVMGVGEPWLRASVFAGLDRLSYALLALLLPLLVYQAAWRGIAVGLGDIPAFARNELLFSGAHFTAALIAVLAFPAHRVEALIGAFWIVHVAQTSAMLRWCRRRGARWHPPTRGLAREVFAYGKWVYVGNFAATLRTQIDQVIANVAGGAAALGIYNQAASLASRALRVAGSLDIAAFSAVAGSERAESLRLVASGTRQMVLIGVVLSIGGCVAAPVIPLIFGADFAASVAPFRVLVVSLSIAGAFRMIAMYFSGTLGDARLPMIVNWTAVAIQTASSVALIAPLGPLRAVTYGAAIGWLASAALFAWAFLRRPEAPAVRELFVPRREDLGPWVRLAKRVTHR